MLRESQGGEYRPRGRPAAVAQSGGPGALLLSDILEREAKMLSMWMAEAMGVGQSECLPIFAIKVGKISKGMIPNFSAISRVCYLRNLVRFIGLKL